MNRIAHLPAAERNELFRETAARRGMSSAVVEKDFWVCWVLRAVFADPRLSGLLLFKGGTSLAKVFGLIERFSEDIDLVLNWGEVTDEDPTAERSRTKQDRLNKEMNADAARYIDKQLVPILQVLLAPCCAVLPVQNSGHEVAVRYPAAFPDDYLRPDVLLEIGPLASRLPHDTYEIRSYAAEEFPEVFEAPACSVHAIKAERTFWEKATILHHEGHRPAGSRQPKGYSRHYYDLFCMCAHEVKNRALSDMDLLRDDRAKWI